MLQKLRAAGLKLKPSKCEFFKDRISYLGHIVSKDGVETDPKKVKAIQKWPKPETVYDVRSFLGFTNYYRKFMFRYSRIAKPLNELISGENAKKKKAPVIWEEKHQKHSISLSSCVQKHQFWLMPITRSHLRCIQTLVKSV